MGWTRRLLLVSVVAVAVPALTACSVAFPSSVRSAGLDCSTSRFWLVSDAALTGGSLYLTSVVADDAGAAQVYIGFAAVFGASAIYGYFKRRSCANHRDSATPEQWAAHRQRKAADAKARAEAQAEADREHAKRREALIVELQARQAAQDAQRANQPAEPVPSDTGPTPRKRQPTVRGDKRLTLNDCTYTDKHDGALGKPCSISSGCPGSYLCSIMVGSSGQCVPKRQADKCNKAKGYKTVGGKCKSDRDCTGRSKGFRCKKSSGKKSGYCIER